MGVSRSTVTPMGMSSLATAYRPRPLSYIIDTDLWAAGKSGLESEKKTKVPDYMVTIIPTKGATDRPKNVVVPTPAYMMALERPHFINFINSSFHLILTSSLEVANVVEKSLLFCFLIQTFFDSFTFKPLKPIYNLTNFIFAH